MLWRNARPPRHPGAGSLSPAQKDRLLRLALVGKRTNYYGGTFWDKLRRDGATDADLLTAAVNEFRTSSQRDPRDTRRVVVDFWSRGKKTAVFMIGAADDPGVYRLEGRALVAAVRRAMRVGLTRAEALAILAELDAIDGSLGHGQG